MRRVSQGVDTLLSSNFVCACVCVQRKSSERKSWNRERSLINNIYMIIFSVYNNLRKIRNKILCYRLIRKRNSEKK